MLDNIEKLALSLRTKTTVWLTKNPAWKSAWFSDPEATEVTEGGEVFTDAASYLKACKRRNKWFDSFSCLAAAEVLQTDIMVFKFAQGQWVFLQRFVPTEPRSSGPIPLFLKNGHFQTCDPATPLPQHWKRLDPKDVGPALSFLRGETGQVFAFLL